MMRMRMRMMVMLVVAVVVVVVIVVTVAVAVVEVVVIVLVVIIIVAIALFNPSIKEGIRTLRRAVIAKAIPPWTLFAGMLGASFVAVQTQIVPLIGVAIYSVAAIAGQSAISLVVDRIGLTGGGKKQITPRRVTAAFVTVLAVFISVADHRAVDYHRIAHSRCLRQKRVKFFNRGGDAHVHKRVLNAGDFAQVAIGSGHVRLAAEQFMPRAERCCGWNCVQHPQRAVHRRERRDPCG